MKNSFVEVVYIRRKILLFFIGKFILVCNGVCLKLLCRKLGIIVCYILGGFDFDKCSG